MPLLVSGPKKKSLIIDIKALLPFYYSLCRFVGMVVLLLLVCAPICAAQGSEKQPTGRIKLNVTGFRTNDGVLKIALVDSEAGYRARKGQLPRPLSAASLNIKEAIQDGQVKHTFTDIPHGEYAVKLFHDENSNGQLDTNMLGIPNEPYGFSKNARALGLPAFEKVKFDLQSDEVTLDIRIK